MQNGAPYPSQPTSFADGQQPTTFVGMPQPAPYPPTPQPTTYVGPARVAQPNGYPMPLGGFQVIPINRNAATGMGITQIIIGILCFILNIVLLGVNGGSLSPSFVGYGLWAGILFFVSGLLQVLSATQADNKCYVIGAMVMNIISACICAIVFALGIIEAINGNKLKDSNNSYSNGYNFNTKSYSYEFASVHLAIGVVMVILSLLEAALAIASSALYCGDTCCKFVSALYPNRVVTNQPVVYQANHPGPPY